MPRKQTLEVKIRGLTVGHQSKTVASLCNPQAQHIVALFAQSMLPLWEKTHALSLFSRPHRPICLTDQPVHVLCVEHLKSDGLKRQGRDTKRRMS